MLSHHDCLCKVKYGEEAWDNIRRLAGLDSPDFAVHQVYPEQLLGRLKTSNVVPHS